MAEKTGRLAWTDRGMYGRWWKVFLPKCAYGSYQKYSKVCLCNICAFIEHIYIYNNDRNHVVVAQSRSLSRIGLLSNFLLRTAGSMKWSYVFSESASKCRILHGHCKGCVVYAHEKLTTTQGWCTSPGSRGLTGMNIAIEIEFTRKRTCSFSHLFL